MKIRSIIKLSLPTIMLFVCGQLCTGQATSSPASAPINDSHPASLAASGMSLPPANNVAATNAAGISFSPSLAATFPASGPATSQAMIKLNFRGQVELKTLIQFVSSNLGINIHYDDAVAKKQITVVGGNNSIRDGKDAKMDVDEGS